MGLGSINDIGWRTLASRRSLLTFAVGLAIGVLVTTLCDPLGSGSDSGSTWVPPFYAPSGAQLRDAHSSNDLRYEAGPELDVGAHGSHEEAHALENTSAADRLFNDVRILCWVMTSPENHAKKARHVQRTWGKRCNKILFMSSKADPELNTIALPVAEGRENLWAKTKEAFGYIYANHLQDGDWFIKADDDTYVILENLRYMLAPYPPEAPIYFGCRFKPFIKQGYMSGGAGYVLSREALVRFIERGVPDAKKCRQSAGGAEDVEMGKCMQNLGVVAGDSRDSAGRGRFFPFVPEHHLIPGHMSKDSWYWKYIYYKTDKTEGLDCCSDNAISFHYVSPNQMYVLDYLIYHLRPYGIVAHPPPIAERMSVEEALASVVAVAKTTVVPQTVKNAAVAAGAAGYRSAAVAMKTARPAINADNKNDDSQKSAVPATRPATQRA